VVDGNDRFGFVKMIAEVFFLYLLFQAGSLLANAFSLPVPPALIGMGLLFFILVTGRFKPTYLERSSSFFIRHLILLLLPAIVGVVQYKSVLEQEGWKLVLIIVCSTVVVLVSTAWMTRLFKKKEDA
jgi:holin-like protein